MLAVLSRPQICYQNQFWLIVNYHFVFKFPWSLLVKDYLTRKVSTGSSNGDSPLFNLIHWGRVTHIGVGNLNTIGPDKSLSPGKRQTIIWNNAGILFIGHVATYCSEILIEISIFSFNKIRFKMSSGKCRSFCLGFSALKWTNSRYHMASSGFDESN